MEKIRQKSRLTDGIKNPRSIYVNLHETHFRAKDTDSLKVRGWKEIFHANGTKESWSSSTHIDKVQFIFFYCSVIICFIFYHLLAGG